MNNDRIKWLVLAGTLATTSTAGALEVDREVLPRITLGGHVVTTLDAVEYDSDITAEDEISASDSSLLLRLDKRLYNKGVAGGVLGFKERDDGVVFHEIHAFYWDQRYQASLGRTRLPNTVVEFPTLRDDDLLTYSHVGNASSDGEFDQLYGDLFSVDYFLGNDNQTLGLWLGTRRNDVGVTSPNGLDSYGGGYHFEVSDDLRYVKRLRQAGLIVDMQKVQTLTGRETMRAVIAGAEFNLHMDPRANWSMALQAIANEGIDGQVTLATVSDQSRAKSRSYVMAWRYTARPRLLTRWQASLTTAYKDYPEITNASHWSVVPALAYRIGQGIDVLAQWRHTRYDSTLFNGGADDLVQLGIKFSFDTLFNDTIGERDSILNLEHGYIQ